MTIPEGSKVFLFFAAANRDPRNIDHVGEIRPVAPPTHQLNNTLYGLAELPVKLVPA